QSAAQDQVTLALVLIIGFGLHNATEGFGIVAPLSGSETRPTWKFLFLLGLIGGGPTFVGTLLGHVWVNETVSVAFLALAAGSILYVVIQLMNVNQKLGYKTLVMWMLLAGLFLGFAADLIIQSARISFCFPDRRSAPAGRLAPLSALPRAGRVTNTVPLAYGRSAT